jgi:phage terminase large subunit GpA-like protein
MNAFNDPAVEKVILKFSSQIGKTEALFGVLMYSYGVDPGPAMLVLPTLELAGAVSSDRLAPALRTCAALKVGSQKSRATDDAVLHKRINGVPLSLAGANSTAGLSSRPVRNVFGDEIDRWPATTPEGEPLALVTQRAAAYRRRKVYLTSTPTIKGASRIDDLYDLSDRRELYTPCPRCGESFVVRWRHVRWESGQPETAHIRCPRCDGRIEDSERKAVVAASEWRATVERCSCGEVLNTKDDQEKPADPVRWRSEHAGPGHEPKVNPVRGYHTWAWVSPWVRLEEIVAAFLKAKERPETLQAWINLTLGESWEMPSQRMDSATLLYRREAYPAEVPSGAKVLTAGVDTQDDRLELLVIGWGPGEEAWVVSRDMCYGDPAKPDVWAELDQHLNRAWPRDDGGASRVQCSLVDALGHRTSAVYAAVAPRQHRRVFVSIGKDGGEAGQLVSAPKALVTPHGNVLRYIVDASQAKALVYSRLKIEERSGPGVIHFPMTVGDAFFTELTSEHMITERNKYGVPSSHWAVRPGYRRNETLDCFGMALAALRAICPTAQRFAELAAKLEKAPPAAPAAAPQARQPRTRNWGGGGV